MNQKLPRPVRPRFILVLVALGLGPLAVARAAEPPAPTKPPPAPTKPPPAPMKPPPAPTKAPPLVPLPPLGEGREREAYPPTTKPPATARPPTPKPSPTKPPTPPPPPGTKKASPTPKATSPKATSPRPVPSPSPLAPTGAPYAGDLILRQQVTPEGGAPFRQAIYLSGARAKIVNEDDPAAEEILVDAKARTIWRLKAATKTYTLETFENLRASSAASDAEIRENIRLSSEAALPGKRIESLLAELSPAGRAAAIRGLPERNAAWAAFRKQMLQKYNLSATETLVAVAERPQEGKALCGWPTIHLVVTEDGVVTQEAYLAPRLVLAPEFYEFLVLAQVLPERLADALSRKVGLPLEYRVQYADGAHEATVATEVVPREIAAREKLLLLPSPEACGWRRAETVSAPGQGW